MKATVKLIENSEENLENLPLFYDYIYTNPILDSTDEEKIVKFSARKHGFISYGESDKLISKIIDFSQIPSNIFTHDKS